MLLRSVLASSETAEIKIVAENGELLYHSGTDDETKLYPLIEREIKLIRCKSMEIIIK